LDKNSAAKLDRPLQDLL